MAALLELVVRAHVDYDGAAPAAAAAAAADAAAVAARLSRFRLKARLEKESCAHNAFKAAAKIKE